MIMARYFGARLYFYKGEVVVKGIVRTICPYWSSIFPCANNVAARHRDLQWWHLVALSFQVTCEFPEEAVLGWGLRIAFKTPSLAMKTSSVPNLLASIFISGEPARVLELVLALLISLGAVVARYFAFQLD